MSLALPPKLTSYLLEHTDVFSDVLDRVLRVPSRAVPAPPPVDFRGPDKKKRRVGDDLFHNVLIDDMHEEIYRQLFDPSENNEDVYVALLNLGLVCKSIRAETRKHIDAFIIRINMVDIICQNVVAYFHQPAARTLFLEALRTSAPAVYFAWKKLLADDFWSACLQQYLAPLAASGKIPAFISDGHAPMLIIAALAGRDPDFDAYRLQDFAWTPGMDVFFAAFGTIPDNFLYSNLFVPLAIRLRIEGDPRTDNASIALLMEQFEFSPHTCAHLETFSLDDRSRMIDDLTVICAYAANDDARLARFVDKLFSIRVPVPTKKIVLVHLLDVLIRKGEESACLPRLTQMVLAPYKTLRASPEYEEQFFEMDMDDAQRYVGPWEELENWLGQYVVHALVERACDKPTILEYMDMFGIGSLYWKVVIRHFRVDLLRQIDYNDTHGWDRFTALYAPPGDSTPVDPTGARQLAMFEALAARWEVIAPHSDDMIVADVLYDRLLILASKPGRYYKRQVDLANLAWRVMYATKFDPDYLRIGPSNFADYDSVAKRVVTIETYAGGNFGGIEKRLNHILICALRKPHEAGTSFLCDLLKYAYDVYCLYNEYVARTPEGDWKTLEHFGHGINIAFHVPKTVFIHPSNLWRWLQSPLRIALAKRTDSLGEAARADRILCAKDPLRYMALNPSPIAQLESLSQMERAPRLRSQLELAYFYENALIIVDSLAPLQNVRSTNVRAMVANTHAYLADQGVFRV